MTATDIGGLSHSSTDEAALAAYNDYQLMLPEPDGRVDGWVMDLERRVAAIATR